MENDNRDARGRFRPGCSGNPMGKKPGTLNRATRLRQWLDDPERDDREVAKALVAQAVTGNVVAIRLYMERCDPKPTSRSVSLLRVTSRATHWGGSCSFSSC